MMRRWLQPSIGRRVLLALLCACALVWVAIYGAGRLGVHAPERGNFDRELRLVAGAAQRLAGRHADPADPMDSSELVAALDGLAAYLEGSQRVHGVPADFVSFRVADRAGRRLAGGGLGPVTWPEPDERSGFFMHHDGHDTFRVYRAWSPDGRYVIDAASSAHSRAFVFNEVMLSPSALMPLLYGFPLLLLPVWLAVHTGLAPLRRLSAELSARLPDDLSPVRVRGVYRELTPLIDELNAAFARLGALLERERSFLADAAHELRTPLAVMLAQSDGLRAAATPQERDAALHRLDQGLMRASRLVGQLLALARLDAQVEDLPADKDLADLARDCLAAHAAAARTRGIELAYDGPDSLVQRCPGLCVESILDNLVGNAVRYGREGGQIEVGLERLASGALRLRVRDDGPGIPEAQRAQMFERFRRGAAVTASGSGLGLAIVQSAARRLPARIEVGAGLDGRGIGFSLTWPGAPGG